MSTSAERASKSNVVSWMRKNLFVLNFFRVHLIYFLTFILIGSLFVLLLPGGGYNISYIDALSLSSSAMTTTGLNVVDLGDLSTGQQVVLVVLMLIGNQIFTGSFSVWVRRYYFRQHFMEIVQLAKKNHCSLEDAEKSETRQHEQKQEHGDQAEVHRDSADHQTDASKDLQEEADRRQQAETEETSDAEMDRKEPEKAKALVDRNLSHHKGLGAFPNPFEIEALKFPLKWINPSTRSADALNHDYLSFKPVVKRNSHFHGLSQAEEEELGGVEYAALELLTWLLPLYLIGWILLGIVILAPWATYTHIGTSIKEDQPGNLNSAWFASFLTVSAFVNCGYDLLNSSFSEINGEYLVILVAIVLLLAGNTLFPVLLRLSIWLIHVCVPRKTRLRATTRFLLDHPRRTFFSLFPA